MAQQSLGEFEELVLLTVASMQGEAYGVAILQVLEKDLKRSLNISAVHVALRRMENKGFVKSHLGGITEDRGGRSKRYYVITALGKKLIVAQRDLRNTIFNRIPKISFG